MGQPVAGASPASLVLFENVALQQLLDVAQRRVDLVAHAREAEGLYQTTDLKVIVGTDELGTYYPTEADRIQYTQAGATREAKIISVLTYRGDDPVMHTLIVRPQ